MRRPAKAEIQAFLKTDRAMLIVCISIAFVFWVFVKLSLLYKSTIPVDINYVLPKGKSILKSPPTQLIATIEGAGWDLMSNYFTIDQPIIDLELSDAAIQTINRSSLLYKVKEQISGNIEVDEIDLESILLQIEDEHRKRLAVQLPDDISIDPSYKIKQPFTIIPDSIEMVGPASLIDSLVSWPLVSLDLKNIRGLYQQQSLLVEPDNSQLQLSTNTVMVDLVVEQLTEKTFFLPITIKNAPDSLKIFPDKVKLSFITGLSQFNDFDKKDFKAVVDLKDISLNAENNTIPIQLTIVPSSVTNAIISPNSVEFFIVK